MRIEEVFMLAGINPGGQPAMTAGDLRSGLAAVCSKMFPTDDQPEDFFVSESISGTTHKYDALWAFGKDVAVSVKWSVDGPREYRFYPKHPVNLKVTMAGCNPEGGGYFPQEGSMFVQVGFGDSQGVDIRATGVNCQLLFDIAAKHLRPQRGPI